MQPCTPQEQTNIACCAPTLPAFVPPERASPGPPPRTVLPCSASAWCPGAGRAVAQFSKLALSPVAPSVHHSYSRRPSAPVQQAATLRWAWVYSALPREGGTQRHLSVAWVRRNQLSYLQQRAATGSQGSATALGWAVNGWPAPGASALPGCPPARAASQHIVGRWLATCWAAAEPTAGTAQTAAASRCTRRGEQKRRKVGACPSQLDRSGAEQQAAPQTTSPPVF